MEDEVRTAASKTYQMSRTQFSRQASEQQDGEQSPTSSEYPTGHRKRRRVRRKKKLEEFIEVGNFDIPGVSKIIISPTGQKTIECTVGEHVTSENPWKYVSKEALEDNLEAHEGSSEFLPIKNELLTFPRPELLLGYIPDETREYDEFYICLTAPAEEAVSEIIERLKKQQEDRLYNAINKTVKPWKTWGSEKEVNRMLNLPNRPLLEVEVETEYPIMSSKCQFRLRLAEQVRDGYMEILPGRTVYSNVYRATINAAVQVTPTVRTNEAQTICTYPKNAWTQYEYDSKTVETPSKEFEKSMKSFAAKELDFLSDMINVNGSINFYTNDYRDLVKNEKYTRVPVISTVKEYTSFIDEKVCKGKEIASVSWHPMWTGTVAVAYSDEAPSSYRDCKPNADEVAADMYDVIPVLLWSFKDTLNPRLYLETPRQVNVVSFCPYDENILIGGCINGQLVIWDITNKLKGVEEEEYLTNAQQGYRLKMFSLMNWMKNTKDLKQVRVTVVSELEYSHKSAVTAIRWFSPYREMSRSGQIRAIPDEDNRKSLQFMTSSRDGTVLTWDLLAKPLMYTGTYKPQRKLRRLKKRPSALSVNASPLKDLHRVLKPLFKITIFEPNTTRPLPLGSLSIRSTAPIYEEVNPDPHRAFNITDRIVYRPLFNKPVHTLLNKLIVGTTEGDFLHASWEGFDFNAGEVVNKETAKVEALAKYHDGPVVSLSRSELFPDLCLTVGGKVFCLWKLDLPNQPVIWRRSKYRYTQGLWNSYRPSMFRLTRNDGAIELWHLKTRSDRYHNLTQVSGKGISGTFTHSINMKQNILGVGDATGALRLFYVAQNLTQATEEDKSSTYKICEREVSRKKNFIKWQTAWLLKNAEWVKEKKEQDLLLQQEREEQAKKEKERSEQQREQQAKDEENRIASLAKPQPGQYTEWAQRQWMLKEKERMNKVLLNKKALDIDLLEKQQLPLRKSMEQEDRKKIKQKYRLNQSSKIFDDTVAMLFPEAVSKKPMAPLDPYGGGDPTEVKEAHFHSYKKVEEDCNEFVRTHPYIHHFNWFDVIKSGRERRKVLDGYYTRYNHTNRLIRERKQRQKESGNTSVPKKVEVPIEEIDVDGTDEYTTLSEEVLVIDEDSVE